MAKKPLLMTDLRLETNRDDLKPKVEEGADTGTKTEQPSFDYKSYVESPDVTKARNDMNSFIANKPKDWTGGTYGAALNDAVNKILNREKFSYDLNGDALYQQYKDQYMNAGRIAMNDTIGQASAMTGGYGNSYAATAGNQAYQGYLQNLNNVVPELYQLAFSKYNQEGQNLLDNYNAINSAYNQEYGQYRDSVNDWYTEANRLVDAYQGAYSMDYGRYADDFNRSLSAFNANNSSLQNTALTKAQAEWAKTQGNYETQLLDMQNQMDALNDKYSTWLPADAKAQANTPEVQKFSREVMTPEEFGRHTRGIVIDGENRRFNSYKEYIDYMLEKKYKAKELTEDQISYLKGQYGL